MAKIYSVIQIKLNKFKKMSIMITHLSMKRISALSQRQTSLKSFYLQDGGENQLA